VQARGPAAVEQHRHLQNLRRGHDAGAADPGHPHDDVLGGAEPRFRIGWIDRRRRRARRTLLCRRDEHERRTVALQAGEVLRARRLMDLRLTTQLGLDGRHRQAARRVAAVAAALADALVDPHPLRGCRQLA
jgi:hypothetical protein